jgi:cytochrome P450
MTAPTAVPQFSLARPQEIADPYPIYRRYRELDPVHLVSPSGVDGPQTCYVFRYADVTRVMASRSFGRSSALARQGQAAAAPLVPAAYPVLREMVANWLVFLDPPRHTKLRSLILKEFVPNAVSGLRPRITEIARALVEDVRRKPYTDLVADYSAPLPILVICALLGVPHEQWGWLREGAIALQEANSSRARAGEDRYARAESAARRLSDYFLGEIERRRREPRNDVIGLLVRAEEHGARLSDPEIIATCVHLMTAGHETTTNLISKGILGLLAHPTALDELRSMPQLMPGAVEELVRYDSPVQMVTRWAYQDEVLAGRRIARGTKVVLVLGSANRDADQFRHPDVLDIRRTLSRHCGFGMGIHYCLGAPLARLEGEIALSTLVRELPGLGPGDEPPEYADDLVFHGPARLPLRTGRGHTSAHTPTQMRHSARTKEETR